MNKKLIDRIKKENYVTSYPTGTSGYLTPAGEWVHLIAKIDEDRGSGYRDDHKVIGSFLNRTKDEDYTGFLSMCRVMKRHGYIRYSPECHGFQFIKKPTREQVEEIKRYRKDYCENYYEDVLIERVCNNLCTKQQFKDFNDFLNYCR